MDENAAKRFGGRGFPTTDTVRILWRETFNRVGIFSLPLSRLVLVQQSPVKRVNFVTVFAEAACRHPIHTHDGAKALLQ